MSPWFQGGSAWVFVGTVSTRSRRRYRALDRGLEGADGVEAGRRRPQAWRGLGWGWLAWAGPRDGQGLGSWSRGAGGEDGGGGDESSSPSPVLCTCRCRIAFEEGLSAW